MTRCITRILCVGYFLLPCSVSAGTNFADAKMNLPSAEHVSAQLRDWAAAWETLVVRYESRINDELRGDSCCYLLNDLRQVRRERFAASEDSETPVRRDTFGRNFERNYWYVAQYEDGAMSSLRVGPNMGVTIMTVRKPKPRFLANRCLPLAGLGDARGKILADFLLEDSSEIVGFEDWNDTNCLRVHIANKALWLDPEHQYFPVRMASRATLQQQKDRAETNDSDSDAKPDGGDNPSAEESTEEGGKTTDEKTPLPESEWTVTSFTQFGDILIPATGTYVNEEAPETEIAWTTTDLNSSTEFDDSILLPPEPEEATKVSGWELTKQPTNWERKREQELSEPAAPAAAAKANKLIEIALTPRVIVIAVLALAMLFSVRLLFRTQPES